MTNRDPAADAPRAHDESGIRGGRVRSLARSSWKVSSRFGWGLADQGLSSITNFALGVVVARTVSARDFGAFGIAFGVYTAGLGLMRAMSSEPLMVRFSAVMDERWRVGARAATGTALAVGFVAGLACFTVGSLIANPVLAAVLRSLGITFPGLLVQDTWRFAFFAAGRGSAAFVNDLVWAAALFASMAYLLSAGQDSVGWLVLAWGGSGSVAGMFGALQSRVGPVPTQTVAWVREQRDLIPRYVGEFGVTTLAAQVSIVTIGAVGGLAAVGAIRAGQLLFGPLNVIYMGAGLAGLPEAVRLLRSSTGGLRRACVSLSIMLASSALAVGVLASLLPERVGVALLGESWPAARTVILPISIWMAGFGVALGAGIGLRALAAAQLSLRARLLVAPIGVAMSVVGAATAGARGGAWGFATAAGIGAVVWWRFLRRGLREHDRRADLHVGSADGTDVPPIPFGV